MEERREETVAQQRRMEDKLDKLADRITDLVVQQGQTSELLKSHVGQVTNSLDNMRRTQLEHKADLKESLIDTKQQLIDDLKDHLTNPVPHATSLGRRIDELETWKNKATGGLILVGFLGTTGLVALLRGLGVGS